MIEKYFSIIFYFQLLGQMTKLQKSFSLIFIVLLIDQILKIWIKTHMFIGQEYRIIGDWFIIHFTENNGMAFGMEFGGDFGKIALSIFRILAVAAIGYYIVHLDKKNATLGFMLSIALIFAGALGNIIDSAFYGVVFKDSYHQIATFFPESGGYSSFLHGKVVDMLYFPVFEGHFPNWMPIWKGEHFIFFRPVFNIADSSIFIGVSFIVIFQKNFFKPRTNKYDIENV